MNKIDVSIIIVSWNVRRFIEECLSSISPDKKNTYEIIVVDNASDDNTVEHIKQHWPDVMLIENQENSGVARANNQGIKIAHGRYIVLLNPDTQVMDNAIDNLVDFMDSHPDVGIAGGKLLNHDETLQPSVRNFPNPIRDFLYASGLTTILRLIERKSNYANRFATKKNNPRLCGKYISGAFLIIRKDCLDTVGLLDERYQLYFEEPDLCHRILQNGFEIAYVPSAEVIHYGGQSSMQIGMAMHSLYFKSLFRYYDKFDSARRVRIARIAVFMGAVVRCFLLFFGSLRSVKSLAIHFHSCLTIARVACGRIDDKSDL